jgi:hypothetical protein
MLNFIPKNNIVEVFRDDCCIGDIVHKVFFSNVSMFTVDELEEIVNYIRDNNGN